VHVLRTLLLALAWAAAAILIALGTAGIVASMNHLPGTTARPELTWTGDRAAEPAMIAATDQLHALADEVDGLGATARQALTLVVAGDVDRLGTTIATGTDQVGTVRAEAAELDALLAAVPGVGSNPELRLSAPVINRYEALTQTRGVTDGLETDWAAFSGRALSAATLTGLLARHDTQTGKAASEGSAAHYQRAIDLLDESDEMIVQARDLRDDLTGSTDVATLTTWIDRNAAYDAALRRLYDALLESDGRVTDRVRSAFEGEQAARRQLPPDTRGLVVIMSDIARGGLNQAVIAIEEARGALSSAIDLQQRLQAEPAPPG
jgi:hypothetical protein